MTTYLKMRTLLTDFPYNITRFISNTFYYNEDTQEYTAWVDISYDEDDTTSDSGNSFNISQTLDILCSSTTTQYNATNLDKNIQFRDDVTSLLQEVSNLFVTDNTNGALAVNISKIWAYNDIYSTDNYCDLDYSDSYYDIDLELVYSSWIRFEFKFNTVDNQQEWISDIDSIITVVGFELKKFKYFVNDTISVGYC